MISLLTNMGWQTKLIAIAALCIASFATGWQVHGWKTDAGLAHTLTKAEKTRQNIDSAQGKIVKDAQKAESETKIVYRTIREQIHEKNDNRVCFADADSLSLWNRAIAGADTHRPEPAAATDQAGATDPGNAATIATVEQVLTNAAENFQICNENAIRHNALIDAVETLQGKMCVCSQ